jgi:hypothetical protein
MNSLMIFITKKPLRFISGLLLLLLILYPIQAHDDGAVHHEPTATFDTIPLPSDNNLSNEVNLIQNGNFEGSELSPWRVKKGLQGSVSNGEMIITEIQTARRVIQQKVASIEVPVDSNLEMKFSIANSSSASRSLNVEFSTKYDTDGQQVVERFSLRSLTMTYV